MSLIDKYVLILKNKEEVFKVGLALLNANYNQCMEFTNYIFSSRELKELYKYNIIRRHQYLLGRISSKLIIQSLFNVSGDKIQIYNSILGFPILYIEGVSNMQVSITHKNNWGASIVFPEKFPIAIDIESINDVNNNEYIMNTYSQNEIMIINQLNFENKSLLIWTIKEALSKIIKTGMTCPLSLYEIDKIQLFKHKNNNYYKSNFKNFYQYQTLSTKIKDIILSIAVPKNTYLMEIRTLKSLNL